MWIPPGGGASIHPTSSPSAEPALCPVEPSRGWSLGPVHSRRTGPSTIKPGCSAPPGRLPFSCPCPLHGPVTTPSGQGDPLRTPSTAAPSLSGGTPPGCLVGPGPLCALLPLPSPSGLPSCDRTRFVGPTLSRPNAETPNAETPRFAAEKRFIREAAKRGDGRTELQSAFLKVRGWDIYGLKQPGGLRLGELGERRLETRKR